MKIISRDARHFDHHRPGCETQNMAARGLAIGNELIVIASLVGALTVSGL